MPSSHLRNALLALCSCALQRSQGIPAWGGTGPGSLYNFTIQAISGAYACCRSNCTTSREAVPPSFSRLTVSIVSQPWTLM
jgi:hypothetical protein